MAKLQERLWLNNVDFVIMTGINIVCLSNGQTKTYQFIICPLLSISNFTYRKIILIFLLKSKTF